MAPLKCMAEIDWLMGLPIPDSEKPPNAVQGFFEPQPQTPPDQISEARIKDWESSKSRLEFARLVNYEGVLETHRLLSQYLGFSDARPFYYFADFIGKFLAKICDEATHSSDGHVFPSSGGREKHKPPCLSPPYNPPYKTMVTGTG